MKKEAIEVKKEMERLVRAEEQARLRLGEIEEAFRENHLTLENARAEIETLRGELAVSNSTRTSGPPLSQTFHIQDTEGARASSVDRTTSREVTASNEKRELEEEIAELKEKLTASSERRTELEQQLEGGDRDSITALRQELEERSAEIDALRKKTNREAAVTVEPARPVPLSPSSRHDLNSARDEIKGLKSVANSLSVSFSLTVMAFRHIIQELQKENQAVKQQSKLMESENQLLLNETEQLRQVCCTRFAD
jgi:CAP-Gly domain-containing linker protein 1